MKKINKYLKRKKQAIKTGINYKQWIKLKKAKIIN